MKRKDSQVDTNVSLRINKQNKSKCCFNLIYFLYLCPDKYSPPPQIILSEIMYPKSCGFAEGHQ